uniref:Uncharacterized protein n=1 Tax=Oryza glumipatula TaxID=40148 RepID=A0A0D9YXC8_9ORYZ
MGPIAYTVRVLEAVTSRTSHETRALPRRAQEDNGRSHAFDPCAGELDADDQHEKPRIVSERDFVKMSSRTDIDSAKMSFLEATTSVSVATLVRINKFDGMHEGFAIGSVVYTDKTNIVVLTNASAYNEDKNYLALDVGDGKLLKAENIATNGNSVLRCLLFRNASNFKGITFSKDTVERGQVIFTPAKAWADIPPSLYPGSVIHPKCTSIENFLRGPVRVVNRYDNHFSVTCPVSGPMPQLVCKEFNFCNQSATGFI